MSALSSGSNSEPANEMGPELASKPAPKPAESYTAFNALSAAGAPGGSSRVDLQSALFACCGSVRWVNGMLAAMPFASQLHLLSTADTVWRGLQPEDYLEAFAHHPKIGADLAELERKFKATASVSAAEQASVANATHATLLSLAELNLAYEQRHGFIFIVCATGKSAEEMLELLRGRLDNPTDVELAAAAREQAKITQLRLQKWHA